MLLSGPTPRLAVVALNDELADGRDVSWIWDVDYEPLLEGLAHVVVSGGRSEELALRFAYGGLDRQKIEVVPALEEARDRGLALTAPGDDLIVVPTYTAMLALRGIIARRGFVPEFWERAS
jgi:UDP-N-acetylmuramyl tripeptide synthase